MRLIAPGILFATLLFTAGTVPVAPAQAWEHGYGSRYAGYHSDCCYRRVTRRVVRYQRVRSYDDGYYRPRYRNYNADYEVTGSYRSYSRPYRYRYADDGYYRRPYRGYPSYSYRVRYYDGGYYDGGYAPRYRVRPRYDGGYYRTYYRPRYYQRRYDW